MSFRPPSLDAVPNSVGKAEPLPQMFGSTSLLSSLGQESCHCVQLLPVSSWVFLCSLVFSHCETIGRAWDRGEGFVRF